MCAWKGLAYFCEYQCMPYYVFLFKSYFVDNYCNK